MSTPKWKLLTEEQIIKAYNESTTLKEFSLNLGYKSTHSKESFKELFETYNLDENKFNYHAGKDITGQYFGFLEALEIDYEMTNKYHRRYWKCLCHNCEQNNIVSVRLGNLTSGEVRSCGCLAKGALREDLVGQIYGNLKVIKLDKEASDKLTPSGQKKTHWWCQCLKCNRPDLVSVSATHLKSGHTTTCGCGKNSNYSIAEEEIEKILTKHNINYEREYSFEDLRGTTGKLRFDFAIFENNKIKCLIEYNGIQHYIAKEHFGGEKGLIKQQERDNKKIEYCKKHNIPLLILNQDTGYNENFLINKITSLN